MIHERSAGLLKPKNSTFTTLPNAQTDICEIVPPQYCACLGVFRVRLEGQFRFPGTKAMDLFAQEKCGASRNRQIVGATIESEMINAFGK